MVSISVIIITFPKSNVYTYLKLIVDNFSLVHSGERRNDRARPVNRTSSHRQYKLAVLREFQEFWEFGGESRAQCSGPQAAVH